MKIIKSFFGVIILLNCAHGMAVSGASTNASNSTYSDEWLDKNLICASYSFMGDYFAIPDSGCDVEDLPNSKVSHPKTLFKKSYNAKVYIVPKHELLNDSSFDVKQEEKNINKLELEYIKKNYNTYISLTEDGNETFIENTGSGWKIIWLRNVSISYDEKLNTKWKSAYIKNQNTNNSVVNAANQCLAELKPKVLEYFPSQGVDPRNINIYISRYQDDLLGISVYVLKQEGLDNKDFDSSKKSDFLAYTELQLDTGVLYFLASKTEALRSKLGRFEPSYLSRLKSCNFILNKMLKEEIYMAVVSKGRTYYHEQPNSETQNKNIFLVPEDRVWAYLQAGGFTYVSYFKKSGEDVKGWIKSEDLMEISEW